VSICLFCTVALILFFRRITARLLSQLFCKAYSVKPAMAVGLGSATRYQFIQKFKRHKVTILSILFCCYFSNVNYVTWRSRHVHEWYLGCACPGIFNVSQSVACWHVTLHAVSAYMHEYLAPVRVPAQVWDCMQYLCTCLSTLHPYRCTLHLYRCVPACSTCVPVWVAYTCTVQVGHCLRVAQVVVAVVVWTLDIYATPLVYITNVVDQLYTVFSLVFISWYVIDRI